MDWLQFTAAIVGHLAWPSVIIVLFVILRKHMGALADRLLEFSFGGAKITFDKILQKGAEIIEHAPLPELPKPPEEPELKLESPNASAPTRRDLVRLVKRGRLQRHLRNSKALIKIMSGLEEVDKLLFEIGDELGIDAADPRSVMYVLIAQKLVPESISKLYETLRDARNVLVHSQTLPDEREANEYMRQTTYLKVFLDLLIDKVVSDKKRDKLDDEMS